jgi:hypothetical protein
LARRLPAAPTSAWHHRPARRAEYAHDGSIDYDDPMFAGDELCVSMTLVSTYDGRVLWHARDHVDREADHPEQ